MKLTLGAAFVYPLLLSFGCSSNSGGGDGPPLGAGDNSATNGGTGSTSGNNGGIGAFTVQGGSSSTKVDVDSSCAASSQPAQLTRVNILFLLDKSGSMGDDPNGGWTNAATRWNPVVTTLDAFFQDQKSTGIYASLSFLPADGDITSACKVTSYSAGTSSIKVPLTLLDSTGISKFLSVLCDPTQPQASTCIKPAGGTPTRPALQGTIDYMATVQQKFPDSKTVIVFLTDGEPGFGYLQGSTVNGLYSCDDLTNGCPLGPAGPSGTGTCSTGDAEVQKVADVIKTAPAKSIYLFGVGELSDTTMSLWGDASLNAAVSLKNMSASDAATTLRTALEGIRSTSLPCNIAVPPPKGGGTPDANAVNVDYYDGAGNVTHLGKSVGCGSAQPSWQYDPTDPTKISLCPNACSLAQKDPNGKVQIVFGCATIIY